MIFNVYRVALRWMISVGFREDFVREWFCKWRRTYLWWRCLMLRVWLNWVRNSFINWTFEIPLNFEWHRVKPMCLNAQWLSTYSPTSRTLQSQFQFKGSFQAKIRSHIFPSPKIEMASWPKTNWPEHCRPVIIGWQCGREALTVPTGVPDYYWSDRWLERLKL